MTREVEREGALRFRSTDFFFSVLFRVKERRDGLHAIERVFFLLSGLAWISVNSPSFYMDVFYFVGWDECHFLQTDLPSLHNRSFKWCSVGTETERLIGKSGWCSGYHDRLTRDRSRVQSPHPILFFSSIHFH